MEPAKRFMILSTLKNLGETNFKEFKHTLRHYKENPSDHQIHWGELEKADAIDVTHLIVSHYTEEGGLRVTLSVLEKMKELDLAKQLRREAITADGAGESSALPESTTEIKADAVLNLK